MVTYLITGCSRGLGLELTKFFVSASSENIIFAAARSKTAALDSVIESSPGQVHFIPLEVTSDDSVSSAVTAVTEKLHGAGLDVLINNAGIQIYEHEGATKMHALEETLRVNTIGVHRVSSAFLPLLEKGKLKKLVIVSSELGSMHEKDFSAMVPTASYKVSKAAVNMIMVQYALELKPKGFTVFCVNPGWLKTDMGGSVANLEPEVGAKEVVRIIEQATPEDSGKFLQINVPGWDIYHGGEVKW
jgi:NAD(P)-dependent dehydrogenase (short-subunit alcohol dehydrogenase family)